MRLKDRLFALLRGAGVTSVVAGSRWRQARHMILCYHGVSTLDEHEWNGDLYITPTRLRARLEFLRRHGYEILSLREGLARLRAGTLPPQSVSLTFDDGATDFATVAVPILREFSAPATVYVTTYYAEHRHPVFDTALSYVLWKGRASGADLASVLGSPQAVPVAGDEDRRAARALVQEFAKARAMDGDAKQALLQRVASAVGVDADAALADGRLHIMTPATIRALPRDLVDVQLHTHRHRTPRDASSFRRELDDNRDALDRYGWAAGERTHFCYPSGDYSASFVEWMSAQGMESATTCIPGLADARSAPLLLPRFVDTMRASDLAFEAWVSGVAQWLPRGAEYRLDAARA